MEVFKGFFDVSAGLRPEVISSLIVMGIVMILAFIVAIQARFQDPLKKPKGLLFLAEVGVEFFDGLVLDLMGPKFKGFGGYIMAVAVYLFIAFIFGLTGLPSPVTNLAVPLSLALITFILIHATSVKYTKFKYFKRYIEPLPFFLPINLISMWAPLLSMSLRLFGNAISGWCLMTIVYVGLQNLSAMVFGFINVAGSAVLWNELFFAPIVAPVLHLYFDIFSGFIQTTIFIFLTMINIGLEAPEEEDIQEMTMERR
ncbi:MAG: F0F1 ATP synthase subunit A [Bacilli bacterium]|nr:F0F1 ATP synthase subunit A [Bacilli bacterium]